MKYRERTYKAELANVVADGKHVRILYTTDDWMAPESDVPVERLRMDQARDLRDSLGEVIEKHG